MSVISTATSTFGYSLRPFQEEIGSENVIVPDQRWHGPVVSTCSADSVASRFSDVKSITGGVSQFANDRPLVNPILPQVHKEGPKYNVCKSLEAPTLKMIPDPADGKNYTMREFPVVDNGQLKHGCEIRPTSPFAQWTLSPSHSVCSTVKGGNQILSTTSSITSPTHMQHARPEVAPILLQINDLGPAQLHLTKKSGFLPTMHSHPQSVNGSHGFEFTSSRFDANSEEIPIGTHQHTLPRSSFGEQICSDLQSPPRHAFGGSVGGLGPPSRSVKQIATKGTASTERLPMTPASPANANGPAQFNFSQFAFPQTNPTAPNFKSISCFKGRSSGPDSYGGTMASTTTTTVVSDRLYSPATTSGTLGAWNAEQDSKQKTFQLKKTAKLASGVGMRQSAAMTKPDDLVNPTNEPTSVAEWLELQGHPTRYTTCTGLRPRSVAASRIHPITFTMPTSPNSRSTTALRTKRSSVRTRPS